MALPTNAADWRDLLNTRLTQRWEQMQVFDAYYEGDQDLAFITRKYRDAYGSFFEGLTDNWMPLIVDSSVERLRVQGFRFGNQDADDEAWRIWQANGMDATSNMVHTESVKLGIAYWMVTPQGTETPRISAEHPSQTIVATDPADRRKRLAGFKRWIDGDEIFANVYLADRVIKYRTTRRNLVLRERQGRWETIGAESNPLLEVPIVGVPNNPGMLNDGRSDLDGGPIKIQNSINLLLSGLLIGAEFQAYPLRVLLGVDTPKDPATGLPVRNAELKLSQSRLLMFGGDAREMDVKQFSPAELDNMRRAIDGLIKDLCAQSRTPPHYVLGEVVNASGDALKAAETGLVSKVKDKMDPMGDGHEETMRLSFRAMDRSDPRGDATDAETIWRDPEVRSDAERVDAAVKLQTLGVPQEALWERVGASPQEINRWRVMQETDALLNPPAPEQPSPAAASANGGNVPVEAAREVTPQSAGT